MYGFYGLSVWIANDHDHEQALLATKLLKSRVVKRFDVAALIAHDLELWDTGQPPHYDVVYAAGTSLDRLIQTIIAAPHTTLINPHHDPDGGPDR